jgi:hypothetical protein
LNVEKADEAQILGAQRNRRVQTDVLRCRLKIRRRAFDALPVPFCILAAGR